MGLEQDPLWNEVNTQRNLRANERDLVMTCRDAGLPLSQAGHTWELVIPGARVRGWRLWRISRQFFFNTAQSNVNFYSATLTAVGVGGVGVQSLANPTDTKAFTTSLRWEEVTDEYNGLVLDTPRPILELSHTVNGAPGTLYLAARLQFRLLKLI